MRSKLVHLKLDYNITTGVVFKFYEWMIFLILGADVRHCCYESRSLYQSVSFIRDMIESGSE